MKQILNSLKKSRNIKIPTLFYFYNLFSISFTISLIFISNAILILYSVSSVGFLAPHSIALKCVRPISARPLKISCEIYLDFRQCAIASPTTFGSRNSSDTVSPQIHCTYFLKNTTTYVDKRIHLCYNVAVSRS